MLTDITLAILQICVVFLITPYSLDLEEKVSRHNSPEEIIMDLLYLPYHPYIVHGIIGHRHAPEVPKDSYRVLMQSVLGSGTQWLALIP